MVARGWQDRGCEHESAKDAVATGDFTGVAGGRKGGAIALVAKFIASSFPSLPLRRRLRSVASRKQLKTGNGSMGMK